MSGIRPFSRCAFVEYRSKTDLEYAQVMMECYTENHPENEKWEVLKFSYAREEVNKEGKTEANV